MKTAGIFQLSKRTWGFTGTKGLIMGLNQQVKFFKTG
jgi:hypothetical protein